MVYQTGPSILPKRTLLGVSAEVGTKISQLPLRSMYGIVANICPNSDPNVTIQIFHAWGWWSFLVLFLNLSKNGKCICKWLYLVITCCYSHGYGWFYTYTHAYPTWILDIPSCMPRILTHPLSSESETDESGGLGVLAPARRIALAKPWPIEFHVSPWLTYQNQWF